MRLEQTPIIELSVRFDADAHPPWQWDWQQLLGGRLQVADAGLDGATGYLIVNLDLPDQGAETVCGCGFPLVWTGDEWQHDAAPWRWGDDHDPDPTDTPRTP